MINLIDFVRKGAARCGSAFVLSLVAAGSAVSGADPDVVRALAKADVVILGEVHDNAAHHQMQADLLTELSPRAVVWEMITPEQASGLDPMQMADAALTAEQLDWGNSGWPDFALYAPVFAAGVGLPQFGGQVPRAVAGEVMTQGAAAFFGDEATLYGLSAPLSDGEQQQREDDQLANHCNAMPAEMLPMLVEFQRLRDATLAQAVVQALEATGGPVAVITGNGHARTDRGIPVYLARARPGISMKSLGQSEAGQISGVFDLVVDAPTVDRPDPCLAFQ